MSNVRNYIYAILVSFLSIYENEFLRNIEYEIGYRGIEKEKNELPYAVVFFKYDFS